MVEKRGPQRFLPSESSVVQFLWGENRRGEGSVLSREQLGEGIAVAVRSVWLPLCEMNLDMNAAFWF